MKKLTRINSIVLLMIVSALSTQAQKTTTKPKTPTTNKPDTTTKAPPKSKVEKTQADADNYIKMAQDTKSKFKTLFPSKPGDIVYAVIAGITYTDPNLELIKQKMDDIKSTKGLTSSYHNNTAIVKILYKGGDASKLYDNIVITDGRLRIRLNNRQK